MKKIILFIAVVCFCSCDNKAKKDTRKMENAADSAGYDFITAIKEAVKIPQDSFPKNDSALSIKNEKLTYLQAYDKALKLWPIHFEELYIKTSYGKAHVITCGPVNGEPLVLLHGMDASSTMWYPNIKSLSEHYKIYAIDFFLEPGKSVCQGNVKNTNQIVDWYYEMFDQLHLKKFSLIGASRGGWLAITIALHNTSRINKIALLSPAQTFTWIKPGYKILFNISYSMFPKRKHLRSVLETLTFDIDKISQVYINQYYLASKKGIIHKSFFQMTPFSDKQLKSLNMPVLLLIGDHDIINGDKSLKKAKKMLSNLKEQKIKDAGHFLSFDQPAIINKKLLDFLKGY